MVGKCERIVLPSAGAAGVHGVATGRPQRWCPSRRSVDFKSALAVHNRDDCARRRIPGEALAVTTLGEMGDWGAYGLRCGWVSGGDHLRHVVSGATPRPELLELATVVAA